MIILVLSRSDNFKPPHFKYKSTHYIVLHPEYNFDSKFCNIDGNLLHYIDEGTGPAIVMVHGNPTWSFFYRKVISQLSSNHRVIALDHMGCGLSDKPQDFDYCLSNHINNLSILLNRLEVKRFSLIVHDWGGAIGMGVATRNLSAVDKLVILNTAAFRSNEIPLRIALCKVPILGELIVRGFNGFAWPATFMAVEKKLDQSTKACYLRPYNSWSNRIAVSRFVQDIPLQPTHRSYKELERIEKGLERLKSMDIPMLILWGKKDFCFTVNFYDEWRRRFPKAKAHLFEHLGHYILEDGFETVEPFLDSFFNRGA